MDTVTYRVIQRHPHLCFRNVNVPLSAFEKASDVHALLELIFECGQNDFQPVPDRCSVSTGDVVVLHDGINNSMWKVEDFGFSDVTPNMKGE